MNLPAYIIRRKSVLVNFMQIDENCVTSTNVNIGLLDLDFMRMRSLTRLSNDYDIEAYISVSIGFTCT